MTDTNEGIHLAGIKAASRRFLAWIDYRGEYGGSWRGLGPDVSGSRLG